MKIDRAEQLGADADEAHQSVDSAAMDRKPGVAEKTVAQQAVQVEGPRVVARRVGVAQDEVHVVDRVDAAEQAAQKPQPAWAIARSIVARPSDQKRDLRRIERFAVGQPAVGVPPHAADQVPQFVPHDVAAERLVRMAKGRQIMLVEKMSERPMADVVQQSGQPDERLDVSSARRVRAGLQQTFVQRRRGAAGQVHHAQHVLEPRVLGGRKHPPGGLQLVNLPKSLHPRVVDDLPFRHLVRRQADIGSERNIAVNRIETQAFTAMLAHGLHFAMLNNASARFSRLKSRSRPGA